MGVRVIDGECGCANECDSCCSCSTTTTSNTAYTSSRNTTATNQQNSIYVLPHFHLTCKDLVGNCKEFRIENNKSDLRIIGNGNRIRIYNNVGNLNIIGNTTRLKITNNSGHIKYTGNDGRIYLGSDSKQQLVEYIGCNGILKVVNSIELCGGSSKTRTKSSDNATDAAEHDQPTKPLKTLKVKSASYGGLSDCKSKHYKLFAKHFERYGRGAKLSNGSMPNLLLRQCDCGCKCKSDTTKNINIKSSKVDNLNCKVKNNINIVHNVGDIVVKNSVDISM